MLKERKLFWWHVGGFFFVVLIGSLLHFTYEWSGDNIVVGMFSSVNESVWEHFKLGFTSLLLFSAIEYFFVRKIAKNYALAKGVGIIVMNLFLFVFFYTYTAITGEENLLIDIISYIVGAAILQGISFRMMVSRERRKGLGVGFFLLAVQAALLVWFTFDPPNLPPWEVNDTGLYGLDAGHNHE